MYATLANSGIHKKLAVHQIVAMTFLNHAPSGYELVINHIDGDRLNNHKDNLEIVTTRQNTTVKFKDRDKVLTSSYVGVCFDKFKKRWLAAITVGGKQIHLGYHKVEIDAHNAYQKALKGCCGMVVLKRMILKLSFQINTKGCTLISKVVNIQLFLFMIKIGITLVLIPMN